METPIITIVAGLIIPKDIIEKIQKMLFLINKKENLKKIHYEYQCILATYQNRQFDDILSIVENEHLKKARQIKEFLDLINNISENTKKYYKEVGTNLLDKQFKKTNNKESIAMIIYCVYKEIKNGT